MDYEHLPHLVQNLMDHGQDTLAECMRLAARRLRGRTMNDCVLYARDCLDPSNHRPDSNEYLRVHMSKAQPIYPSETRQKLRFRRELGWGPDILPVSSRACRQLQHSVVHSLRPWRVFKEGSSDILDIAWSPMGDKFALGAATLSDVYNRSGNLILGSISNSTITMLHGHQTNREEPLNGQDPILHSTVAGVGFSPSGLLFSGGYDETVKVWSPYSPDYLLNSRKMDGKVYNLSVSPEQHNLVAAGCQTGSLELSSWSDDGNFLAGRTCMLSQTIAAVLFPSCLAWGRTFHSRYLIAGYDSETEKAGSLVVYDATTGVQFMKVVPGSTRHFDIASHPNGSFVVGCAARTAKSMSTKSHVRMFHLTGTGVELEFDVDSEQLDINRVTIS